MKRFMSPLLAAAIVAPLALPVAAEQHTSGTEAEATTEMDAGTVGVDTETSGEAGASTDSSSASTEAEGTAEMDTGTVGVSEETSQSSGMDTQSADTEAGSSTSGSMSSDESDSADASTSGQSAMGAQADAPVVMVGDVTITAGDVQAAIEAFPPQMIQMVPSEQLVPMAVDQLVLRALILDAAEAENLAEDPDVQTAMDENPDLTQDDAVVQVWVRRGLEGADSDEAVQEMYDQASAAGGEALPPLEQVRPQIQQQLQQQRLDEMRQELMGQGVEIVFYDSEGNPVEQSSMPGAAGDDGGAAVPNANGMSGTGTEGASADSTDSEMSTDSDMDTSTDSETESGSTGSN